MKVGRRKARKVGMYEGRKEEGGKGRKEEKCREGERNIWKWSFVLYLLQWLLISKLHLGTTGQSAELTPISTTRKSPDLFHLNFLM
jgi:hypothetical protein